MESLRNYFTGTGARAYQNATNSVHSYYRAGNYSSVAKKLDQIATGLGKTVEGYMAGDGIDFSAG